MLVVRFHNTNGYEVVDFDPKNLATATIRQRNVILEGDHVEFSTGSLPSFEVISKTFTMLMVTRFDRAPNPMELLTITVPQEVKPGDMIRLTKEGLLINPTKKTDQVNCSCS